MITIYTIFLCWQGISQPCSPVDAAHVFPNGEPTTSLSECKRTEIQLNLPRAEALVRSGGVEGAGPHPLYRCMSTRIPAWTPIR
jgi:hypothetical protein